MSISNKISLKSFFIILLSLMISNLSFSCEFVEDATDLFQIEIEEEEEENLFHSNINDFQDILIADGGNDVSESVEFSENNSFLFISSIDNVCTSISFLIESVHTPLYIKYCNIKAHIG